MKFANGLLASTLSQRAELVCLELFERPVTPGRARKLVAMALADLDATLKIDPEQAEAQYLFGRLNAHLGETEKALKPRSTKPCGCPTTHRRKAKALMIRANLQQDPDKQQADYDEAVEADAGRSQRAALPRHVPPDRTTSSSRRSPTSTPRSRSIPKMPKRSKPAASPWPWPRSFDEAMDSFTKTIELEPASANAFTQRARIRAIKGDIHAALARRRAGPQAAARRGAGPATARQHAHEHRQVRPGPGRSDPAPQGHARQLRSAAADGRAVPDQPRSRSRPWPPTAR